MDAESCAAAAANGRPIGAELRARTAQGLSQAGSSIAAPMLRDRESGQRTEHDHVLGALAACGRAAVVAMDPVRLARTHRAVQAARRLRAQRGIDVRVAPTSGARPGTRRARLQRTRSRAAGP